MAGDGMQPRAARAVRARYRGSVRAPRPWSTPTARPRRTASGRPAAAATAPDRRRGPSSRRPRVRRCSRAASTDWNAAVDDDRQVRMRGLQPVHEVVVERRDVAVLARRQAFEPGLARVHDQRIGAGKPPPSRRRRAGPSSGSCSSMPMRHFTVTGIATAAFIAATQSPTSAGSAIRHAPKRPSCTRSEGQPTLRLISSIAELLADARASRERRGIASRQAASATGCSAGSKPRSRAGRRAGSRRSSPSRCRAARGASAGDGRTGSAGRSIPSWGR